MFQRTQNDEGFLFTHTVGKRLRDRKLNEFSLMSMDDRTVCPVAGLEKYVKEAQSIGIDLPTGYLFRPLDHSRRYVVDTHVTTPVMHSRPKFEIIWNR